MRTSLVISLFVGAILTGVPAFADPPPWAGGKGKGKAKGRDREASREERRADKHFAEQHRIIVHEYYGEQFRAGRCPPGLAKKRNGCMPPGQAKKWRIGRPLPPDVIYYTVPPALVVNLGVPPPGYKYVRVAADILLIAVGTAIVVDAIQDLGRM